MLMHCGGRYCSRRDLLAFSGLVGLGCAAAPFLPLEEAEALFFDKKEYKVSKTRLAMGTFVAMTAIHPSRDQAEEAFGRAFEEISRLSHILSRHRADSPVSELNRTGKLYNPPRELRAVVSQSLGFYSLTAGAFDITVKPLMDLYKRSFENGRKPTESEISDILPMINVDGISH